MANQKNIKERSAVGIRRERAPVPWRYFLMSMICGLILAAGFFYAAKQHFASVDYSMRNSEMRKTKEKLEADQRKLKVERETVSSPATIEKAGLKIGLIKYSSQDFQYIDPSGNVTATNDREVKKTPDAKNQILAAKTKDPKAPAAKTDAPKNPTAAAARDNRNDVAKLIVKDTARASVTRK